MDLSGYVSVREGSRSAPRVGQSGYGPRAPARRAATARGAGPALRASRSIRVSVFMVSASMMGVAHFYNVGARPSTDRAAAGENSPRAALQASGRRARPRARPLASWQRRAAHIQPCRASPHAVAISL